MIEAKEILIGKISAKESLIGKLNNAIEKVYPTLQDKTIKPSIEEQKVKADEGVYGLNEITVESVTNEIDENIKSENIKQGTSILGVEGNVIELVGEEITITPKSEEQEFTPTAPANGFTKVKVWAQTGVDINDYFETTITNTNKEYFGRDNYIKQLPVITVASNVNSFANTFSSCDYIKELTITGDTSNVTTCYHMFYNNHFLVTAPTFNTANVTNMWNMFYYCNRLTIVPLYNTANVTTMQQMFSNCSALKSVPLFNTSNVTNMANMFSSSGVTTIPLLDTSNVTNMANMFSSCSYLVSIPQLNTLNATSFNYLFGYSSNLESVPMLNASKIVQVSGMFAGQKTKFTEFGGLQNLGQAYLTTQSANNSNYKLDLSTCPNLTHDSLMNVINNLYDISACNTQQLVLGATNLAKLTEAELLIAQNKNWSVS